MKVRIKIWFLWFLACVLLSTSPKPVLAKSDASDKYYHRIPRLVFGSLVIEDIHVSLVEVPPESSLREEVHDLQLDRGTVHFRRPDQDPLSPDLLSGVIAEGTFKDPAGSLHGHFEWRDGKPVVYQVEQLNLRLKNVRCAPGMVLGGSLIVDNTTRTIIHNLTVLIGGETSPSQGSIEVSTFGTQLQNPELKLDQLPIDVIFSSKSSRPNTFKADLVSGDFQPLNGLYTAAIGTGVGPLSHNPFSDDLINKGSLTLQSLELSFQGGTPRLTANEAHIASPSIRVKGHEDIPVVAVKDYTIKGIVALSKADEPRQLAFDEITSADTFATRDPWGTINQLNTISVFSNRVLIPTDNSTLRYITPYDLRELYRALQQVTPKGRYISNITIDQDHGIVTRVTATTTQLRPAVNGQSEHVFCLLLSGVTGLVANEVVSDLLVGRQTPKAAGIVSWLRYTTLRHPELAEPAFWTGFAVSKGSTALLSALRDFPDFSVGQLLSIPWGAAFVAGGVMNHYCEDFLARAVDPLVLTRPNYLYRPYLFETIQTSPDLLNDELALKYGLYLGRSVKISTLMNDPAARAFASGMAKSNSTRLMLAQYPDTLRAKIAAIKADEDKAASRREEIADGRQKFTWSESNNLNQLQYWHNQDEANDAAIEKLRQAQAIGQMQSQMRQQWLPAITPSQGGSRGSGGGSGGSGGSGGPTGNSSNPCSSYGPDGWSMCMGTRVEHPPK